MAKKGIEELKDRPAASSEQSKTVYPAGVYEFDRGEDFENEPEGRYVTIIARDHEKFGTVQSDALVRVGYKFKRKATAKELTELDVLTEIIRAKQEPNVSRAEFDALQKKLDDVLSEKEAKKDQ